MELGDAIGLAGALDKVAPMKKQFEREEVGRKSDDKYKSKSERGSNEGFMAQGKGGFADDESRIAADNAPMESMSEISMEGG